MAVRKWLNKPSLQKKESRNMNRPNAGDRACHVLRGDPDPSPRWCIITWIEGTLARVIWEDDGKTGGVSSYDLLTEEDAIMEGF